MEKFKVVVQGPSRSGKTTLIKEILTFCKAKSEKNVKLLPDEITISFLVLILGVYITDDLLKFLIFHLEILEVNYLVEGANCVISITDSLQNNNEKNVIIYDENRNHFSGKIDNLMKDIRTVLKKS